MEILPFNYTTAITFIYIFLILNNQIEFLKFDDVFIPIFINI